MTEIERQLQNLDLITLRTVDHLRDGVHRMANIGPLTQHEHRLLAIADDMERMVTGGVS